MSKTELERQARSLFEREVELDQKLFDSLKPAAPEEIGESVADLSADELLERMRDTPSRETDAKLLREAIAAVRQQRVRTLRAIAQADAETILRNVAVQRSMVSKRETRQRELLQALIDFEELEPATGGKLFATIDPSGLLHVSKTRMMAQVLDAQEREANAIALRPVDAGEIRATDLDDAVRRLCDLPMKIGPKFESVRQWFAEQQKAATEQSRFGKVSYRLVWRDGEIVLRGKFNQQSEISVTPHPYRETAAISGGPMPPPGAKVRVTEVV